jgi:hypothetical protein
VGESDGDGEGVGDGGGVDGAGVGEQLGPGTGAPPQLTWITSAPGEISISADPAPRELTATASPARCPPLSLPPRVLSLTSGVELRADQATGPRWAAMTSTPDDRLPRSSAPG